MRCFQYLTIGLLCILNLGSWANAVNNPDRLQAFLNKHSYQALTLLSSNDLQGAYVYGQVNGVKVYILLDTGSNGISIFNQDIKRLGLSTTQNQGKRSANMTGAVSEQTEATLKTLKIGEVTLTDIKAVVTLQPKQRDFPTIVIGSKFLMNHQAIFNFAQKKVYITTKKLTAKDHYQLKQLLSSEHKTSIQLTKLLSAHEIMPVAFDYRTPVNCLVDTGTSNLTIAEDYSHYIGAKSRNKRTIKATDGDMTISDVVIDTVQINPLDSFFKNNYRLSNVNATAANIQTMREFLGVLCIVGFKELNQLNAIYDFNSAILYV